VNEIFEVERDLRRLTLSLNPDNQGLEITIETYDRDISYDLNREEAVRLAQTIFAALDENTLVGIVMKLTSGQALPNVVLANVRKILEWPSAESGTSAQIGRHLSPDTPDSDPL
jgi:hypothetical protein